MGASAQTGIALLQSGEFCAVAATENKSRQQTIQRCVRINSGANCEQLNNNITPLRYFYYALPTFSALNRRNTIRLTYHLLSAKWLLTYFAVIR